MGKISIFKYLKKRTLIIYALMAMLIFSLTTLIFYVISYNNLNQRLVEILGKQRMYTQIISKETLEISVLQNSNEAVHNELKYHTDNLKSAAQNFDNTLSQIVQGYIVADNRKVYFDNSSMEFQRVIADTSGVWGQMRKEITSITDGNNIALTDALTILNRNDGILLNNSDKIVNLVIEAFKRKNFKFMIISLLIIAAILISMALIQIDVFKFLILPIKQLYEGMTDIGLENYKEKRSETKNGTGVPLVEEVNEIFDKLSHLIMLIENINNNDSFKDVLNYMHSNFSSFIPYAYIGIALIEDEGKSIKATYGVSSEAIKGLPKDLLSYTVEIEKTSLGKIIEAGKVRVINDLEKYTSGKPVKEYNQILLRSGIKASITLPLEINGKPVGIIFFSSDKKNVYNMQHVNFLKTLANSIAIGFNKNILLNEVIYSSILALAKLAESRDLDTGEHLQRMKAYSVLIARFLIQDSIYKDQVNIEYIEDIEKFCPLHDIGKVAIRDDILLKPAKLTAEEFEIMKTHTIYGAQVLKEADYHVKKNYKSLFNIGIEIAESHHEKWDGSGYPYGKAGAEIPLSARIVALADVFDALTSKRPYKKAFSFEETCEIIVQGRGTHFDPEIIDIFIKHKDEIYNVYEVLGSNTMAS